MVSLPVSPLARTPNYFDLHVRNLPQAQTNRAYLAASVQAFVNKPLYRPANDAAIEQANVAAKLAELSLMAAEMDVANRLAQAYFDILLARTTCVWLKHRRLHCLSNWRRPTQL